jgi:hypothetical protein
VAGWRVSAFIAVCLLCGPSRAVAQGSGYLFTGMLTGHIGAARGGDVRDAATTVGISMAVIDLNGLGAEVDIAHTSAVDEDFFLSDTSVTSFMLSFIALYPHDTIRPFLTVGAGALHVRTPPVPGHSTVGRTEAGWNAGGGLHFGINDVLAVRGDVRYFRLFDRPDQFVLRDTGFFNYWRTSIGATFNWPIR